MVFDKIRQQLCAFTHSCWVTGNFNYKTLKKTLHLSEGGCNAQEYKQCFPLSSHLEAGTWEEGESNSWTIILHDTQGFGLYALGLVFEKLAMLTLDETKLTRRGKNVLSSKLADGNGLLSDREEPRNVVSLGSRRKKPPQRKQPCQQPCWSTCTPIAQTDMPI